MAKKQDFTLEKGFNLKGYDQTDIDEAQKGEKWDHNDQKRYDSLIKGRSKAKETAQEVKADPKQTTEESAVKAQEFKAEKMPVSEPTSEFDATNRINQASANVQQKVQADAEYDKLDKNVANMSEYYRNQSDKTKLGLFGDMWNTRSFEWKPAKNPAKIETTYNKKDEDEDKE
jgi:hypothetical protein